MRVELESLIRQWETEMPADTRYATASEAEVASFELKWGAIPSAYRTFLLQGGGGAVGTEWLDGINQLHASHAKYSKERGRAGWTAAMFLIGWDGSGAPIGIDPAGAVVVENEGGETTRLAPSFALFLKSALSS